MTFLAMIIALVLQQAWGGSNPVHTDDWYRSWYSEVRRWGVPPAIKLTLAVLAPALLAYVILDALEPVLFGLLWIGAAVWLLVYALGRGDFREQMDNYRRQCLGGNFEGAFLAAGAQMGHAAEGEDPASEEEVHCMAQRALLYEGFQRWFAVLFWFVVLGPAGALAYRLLQLCHDELEPELAARCLFYVDWMPARLLAATFVVTGDFVGSRDEFLGALQSASRDTGELLYRVGSAALSALPGKEENFGGWAAAQNLAFTGLLKRSAGAWLVVISLWVVFL